MTAEEKDLADRIICVKSKAGILAALDRLSSIGTDVGREESDNLESIEKEIRDLLVGSISDEELVTLLRGQDVHA